MIGLIVILIDCWLMAFGCESFIDNKSALVTAGLIEFAIEYGITMALLKTLGRKLEGY